MELPHGWPVPVGRELAGVIRSCYVGWVGNRYSFTTTGLESVELAGVTAAEVWEVLHAAPGHRMFRHLSEGGATVCGISASGRYLMVGLVESDFEDCDWDVVAARELQADEKIVFSRYVRRLS